MPCDDVLPRADSAAPPAPLLRSEGVMPPGESTGGPLGGPVTLCALASRSRRATMGGDGSPRPVSRRRAPHRPRPGLQRRDAADPAHTRDAGSRPPSQGAHRPPGAPSTHAQTRLPAHDHGDRGGPVHARLGQRRRGRERRPVPAPGGRERRSRHRQGRARWRRVRDGRADALPRPRAFRRGAPVPAGVMRRERPAPVLLGRQVPRRGVPPQRHQPRGAQRGARREPRRAAVTRTDGRRQARRRRALRRRPGPDARAGATADR